MGKRRMRALSVAVLLGGAPLLAGARRGQSAAPAQDTSASTSARITGCLNSDSLGFDLTDKEGNLHYLVGATSGLSRYVGDIVQVEGTVNESAAPGPSFRVTSVRLVSKAPTPRLSDEFRNTAMWHAEKNRTYGLKFARPRDFTARTISDAESESNFPIQEGTVLLGSFDFPDIYEGTNLRSGYFSLFANPKIANRASCEQFGRSNPTDVVSSTIGGVRYAVITEGSAAAGTAYSDRYFHTFQNGLCYEIRFDFGEVNTHNYDMWCTMPSLSDADEWNVIRPLLGEVSFVPPEPPIVREESAGSPRVNSFAASPAVNEVAQRGEATFSWSTQNVDFIELSYKCPSGAAVMTILEGQQGRGCGNSLDQTFPLKRSPNGSVTVNFGNFDQDDPVPVVVTLTAFNGGILDHALSKSVTVSVPPWNPLPQGAHMGAQNMTLAYVRGTGDAKRYGQGSSMTIRWTDAEKREPCVNLFLVQEDEHGVVAYRGRFGTRTCQTPASAGTYTWQLPKRYLGSGFHVYAAAPGGTSWALGDRFEIVRTN